ncbi:MAG TPA: divalent metal cation transporter [Saprospiraceae bacterium]|nr:divalent metal cation transporter [Saprospiraceae bacterium]
MKPLSFASYSRRFSGVSLGAAFLMATSAIGPGFLTQTTVFTAALGASFGFVILLSVLLDLGAQVNIWRVVAASGMPAPAIAGRVLPGLGHFLTLLIVLGGLAFNIGNVAGAGLGLEVFAGIPAGWGAAVSGLMAVGLFMSREAGKALDRFARVLGFLMIALTAWVAFSAHPPLGEVALCTFFPEKIDPVAVLTIVGGTVGGYISFAGAHRLLEGGVSGTESIGMVTRSAFTGIGVATLMRLLLFLAAFGVVAGGAAIDPANPPASMFRAAAGELGYRFFGLVMWSAAITSVVGCTFTSVSFLTGTFSKFEQRKTPIMAGFILFSILVFLIVGKPVKTLILAGALNGLILPLALAAMLVAARRMDITGGYRLPLGWQMAGWLVVAVMGIMAVLAIGQLF